MSSIPPEDTPIHTRLTKHYRARESLNAYIEARIADSYPIPEEPTTEGEKYADERPADPHP